MLFYASLFLLLHGNTDWSQVRGVTVYEQTSGPANWSQHHYREQEGSQFYRFQKESRGTEGCCSPLTVRVTFSPLIHAAAYSITRVVPGPVGLWCWWNPTWPGSDQALTACRVTSAKGLSLPLCSHLASSSPRLYFPIPLSNGLSLLASNCHAQTLFSSNSLSKIQFIGISFSRSSKKICFLNQVSYIHAFYALFICQWMSFYSERVSQNKQQLDQGDNFIFGYTLTVKHDWMAKVTIGRLCHVGSFRSEKCS